MRDFKQEASALRFKLLHFSANVKKLLIEAIDGYFHYLCFI